MKIFTLLFVKGISIGPFILILRLDIAILHTWYIYCTHPIVIHFFLFFFFFFFLLWAVEKFDKTFCKGHFDWAVHVDTEVRYNNSTHLVHILYTPNRNTLVVIFSFHFSHTFFPYIFSSLVCGHFWFSYCNHNAKHVF